MEKKNQSKNNEIKNEVKKREIIIETDGSEIQIKKLEVAGILEAQAIFNSIIKYLEQINIK